MSQEVRKDAVCETKPAVMRFQPLPPQASASVEMMPQPATLSVRINKE